MADVAEDMDLSELNEQEIKELEEFITSNKPKEEISLGSLVQSNKQPKRKAPSMDINKLRDHMKDEALKHESNHKNYVEFTKKPRSTIQKKKSQAKKDDDMDLMAALMTADSSELSQICNDLGLDSKLIDELTDPVVKCGLSFPKKKTTEEPEEPLDLNVILEKLTSFDKSISTLNLNNHPDMNPEFALVLFENISNTNCVIERLEMANCQISDIYITELVKSLKTNKSLKYLNIETNYITSKAMLNLINVIIEHETLEVLKICNQNNSLGFELDNMLVVLVEKNPRIKKLSHTFQYNDAKDRFEKILLRNVYEKYYEKKQMKNAVN